MKGTRALALLFLALLIFSANPAAYVSGRTLRGLLQAGGGVPAAEAGLANAVNLLGDAIFGQLANETSPAAGPGIIISPYSIAQALAMLLNGARPNGDSFDQLAALFGSDQATAAQLGAQFQALTTRLLSSPADTGIRVQNANSAWLKEGLQWQPQYADTLETDFNATLGTLTTAQAINSWVADATEDKITAIVTDDFVADAVLLLANAMYFKGSWVKDFPEDATQGAPFSLLGGGELAAATMHQQVGQGEVQVATVPAELDGSDVECEAIQLWFAGFEFAGVAAQPKGNVSAADGDLLLLPLGGGEAVPYAEALAACRTAVLDSLPGGPNEAAWAASTSPILLYLPRFEIEFSASLNKALQALGVTQPFIGGDLTQMAEDAEGNPVPNLAVSEVLHKVYEKVDEKGAEAAAVTAIGVVTSAPVETNPPVELRFDRPFQFIIAHWPSGLAVFNGEIYTPEEWSSTA